MKIAIDGPSRPSARYHGGKWILAPWIISHFPDHRTYTEVYGGAASVLLRKPRVYAEVYNDLDGEMVNYFRVMRNPSQARELIRQIELTPFAREEFENSYIYDGDPIENARRLLVRSFMGFGSGGASGKGTGFRSTVRRSGTAPAGEWAGYPSSMRQIAERMQGVIIENRPALQVLKQFDDEQTLHYVDPPYPLSTRGKQSSAGYRHEMTDDQHAELAGVVRDLAGFVVVSGYQCPLYDRLYGDWERVDKDTHADGALDRVESLWLSPKVSKSRAPAPQMGLFA
jgi:DNA adenine methylase